MSILSFLSDIFKPAADLIDDLVTSDEERLKLKNEMLKLKQQMEEKVLEYETKLLDAQSSIIGKEAMGHSWLQRNWRPITMLTFLILVVLDSFAVLKNPLTEDAWLLLQIGLGGYVVGRSAEKLIPAFAQRKKSDDAKG